MSESRQVAIVSDHFQGHARSNDPCGLVAIGVSLMLRIRQCVECPKCLTRYLLAFSPYSNGSYLVPTVYGSSEEYTLYCSCRPAPFGSRRRWNEMKIYEVSKAAYDRGYGTPAEIVLLIEQPRREKIERDPVANSGSAPLSR